MTLNYGLIGNGQTVALISATGSIDWCCMPTFDSPSIFAKLMDDTIGGHFAIEPIGDYEVVQSYIENTNVLETSFISQDASFKVIDFMPRYPTGYGVTFHHPCEIYRFVEVLHGRPEVIIHFDPKLHYAEGDTHISEFTPYDVLASREDEHLFLHSNIQASNIINKAPISLTHGTFFVLSYKEPLKNMNISNVMDQMHWTTSYWQRWVKHCYIPDNYQDEVIRSALTLKLLIYQKTGAIIASPTTSIPEIIGGNRNWDYRFCWLRDSYFVIDALIKLSQFEETEGFIAYLKNILEDKGEYIRPLYTIEGKTVPLEEPLDHLSGYKNSPPVHVGNSATTHLQDDVYGEMVLALYPLFMDKRIVRSDIDHLWEIVSQLVETAIRRFEAKDNGLWEFRNYPRHYTFSKLMCWVALDRGLTIAEFLGYEKHAERWHRLKQYMHHEIIEKAWNPDLKAFTQAFGSEHLDASTLLMPQFGFIDAKDPRMKSTILLSEERLMRNGFAFRYTNEDDFGVPENAFLICTFWMIDALIRTGERDRAQGYFDNVLQYTNHLGLFSEHINPKTRELTGNFPQGYTHVAIINTAMLLNNR